MAQRERNVKIVVSAETKGLAQVQSKVSKFQAAVAKTQARRKTLAIAAKDIRIASQAYDKAAASATRYARVLADERKQERLTAAEIREVTSALQMSRKATSEAKIALNDKRVALQKLTQAGNANAAQMRNSKAAAVAQASATKGEAAAANSATNALNKLNKTTDRMTKSQTRAGRATSVATMAIRKQGFAAKQSAAWGSRQGRGPLGLRPYELTNLSYQINDVVSGLAMGQRPMQVFAQQSGQIIQIFPKIMNGLFKLAPALAVLAPFVLAMVRLGKETSNLRFFETQLSLMGETAIYSAETLAEVAIQADRAGMSLKDAQAAVIAFTKAGVGEGAIGGFVKMARQLAEVTGVEVTEAVKKLSDAYEDGAEGVLALDRELNFLTASQYEHVRALVKDGRETDALRLATSALEDKLDDVAGKAVSGGPWSQAAQNLGVAWEKFMNYMANSAIVDLMSSALDGLGRAANAAIVAMTPGSGAAYIPTTQEEYAGLSATGAAEIVAGSQRALDELDARVRATAGGATPADLRQRLELVEELTFATDQLNTITASGEMSQLDVPRLVPEQPVDTAEGRIAQSEALEAATKRQLALKEQLLKLESDLAHSGDGAIESLLEEIRLAEMLPRARAQESAVLAEIEAQRKIALERGEEFNGLNAGLEESLRIQAGLLYDINNASTRAGGGGSAKRKEEIAEMELVNRLLEYRTQLQTLLDAQELDGDIVGASQTAEELEQVSVQLDDAIIKALLFWEAMGGDDADVAIAKLKELQLELKATGREALFSAEFINEGIANVMVSAFGAMAEAIANGTNATEAFFAAFRKGAGEFLIQIGEMILQRAILNALSGGGGVGDVGGGVAGLLNSLFFHGGGVVGSGGTSRMVPSSVFAGASRFHSGGLPGLKSNEVAAVLEKGEEVLTRDDSRNVLNGGGSGNGDIKVIMVNNPAEAQRQNFQDSEYQKVHMEWMQENSNEINSMLGR